MTTNSYAPTVSGVVRSVQTVSAALRRLGHQVLIIAPEQDGGPEEEHVVRLPSIQHITANDYAIRLPIPGYLTRTLDAFRPDVIHTHHPLLLGGTALRVAAGRRLPVVFTHHTMYEHYMHYLSGDTAALERFAARLATEFANLCDHVIAPSQSVADVLQERGVESPITVIPTGVDTAAFTTSRGVKTRRQLAVPEEAFVVGHVGRLAPEKNLAFLQSAVIEFLQSHPHAHFVFAGSGPSSDDLLRAGADAGLADRWHALGLLEKRELTDAYTAMDVFVFASHSETQGMVLAEAMAAGVPVVALDASGVREIVQDQVNGRLLVGERQATFVTALHEVSNATTARRSAMRRAACKTAAEYSIDRCVEKLACVYQHVAEEKSRSRQSDAVWPAALRRFDEEVRIWTGVSRAVADSMMGSQQAAQ
ncbi:MAG TPA: glycosyltransferase [Pirellulaceae bacterium]|nr:glycosyltransferase [Pirellulaceae bacterium]